ncbi:MAG: patatin-like phospholipase family protein [Candidatus Promineifilaceae bacterium]
MNRPKVGLVLGGGGTRGLAHIGVLKVLLREQIPFDFIVATSMGGIVASLYGLGKSLDEIGEGMQQGMALNNPETSVLDNVKNVGLVSSRGRQQRMRQQLESVIGDQTFADLQIPVSLMAVDMLQGKEVVLQDGPLVPAILASSAVPGVFPPVVIDGRQLMDGGVIDSVATHVAFEQGADKVIAVDVYPALETENIWSDPIGDITGVRWNAWLGRGDEAEFKRPSLMASLWRASRIMTWHLHDQRLKLHPPDVYMRPAVDAIGSLDFKDTKGPIEAGVIEAERHLEALRELCI